MNVNADCRHFIGEKPCRFRRTCPDCPHYDRIESNVLVIKLAAMGDVLRSTVLLPALKSRWPGARITWLTEPGGAQLLAHNPYIDRLLTPDVASLELLGVQRFDALYCLDKEPLATALATRLEAGAKYGFGRDEGGALVPVNKASNYAYRLGVDDELKFRGNRKTYPEIVFEMAELPYAGQEYVFRLSPEERAFARAEAERLGLSPDRPVIGLNTGCGPVFQMKKWPVPNILRFLELVHRHTDAQVVLYGGPAEEAIHRTVRESAPGRVVDSGCRNSLREFSALLELCDLLVTGDTMAMHVAIGLEKRVVALMGSTSASEIDLFGRGRILMSDFSCAPCYKRTCDLDPWCLQAMDAETVFRAVVELLPQRAKRITETAPDGR